MCLPANIDKNCAFSGGHKTRPYKNHLQTLILLEFIRVHPARQEDLNVLIHQMFFLMNEIHPIVSCVFPNETDEQEEGAKTVVPSIRNAKCYEAGSNIILKSKLAKAQLYFLNGQVSSVFEGKSVKSGIAEQAVKKHSASLSKNFFTRISSWFVPSIFSQIFNKKTAKTEGCATESSFEAFSRSCRPNEDETILQNLVKTCFESWISRDEYKIQIAEENLKWQLLRFYEYFSLSQQNYTEEKILERAFSDKLKQIISPLFTDPKIKENDTIIVPKLEEFYQGLELPADSNLGKFSECFSIISKVATSAAGAMYRIAREDLPISDQNQKLLCEGLAAKVKSLDEMKAKPDLASQAKIIDSICQSIRMLLHGVQSRSLSMIKKACKFIDLNELKEHVASIPTTFSVEKHWLSEVVEKFIPETLSVLRAQWDSGDCGILSSLQNATIVDTSSHAALGVNTHENVASGSQQKTKLSDKLRAVDPNGVYIPVPRDEETSSVLFPGGDEHVAKP